jgi:hypothetical protein
VLSESRELEDQRRELRIRAIEVGHGNAQNLGKMGQCLQIRHVLVALVLVDARTRREGIDSGLDAELLLGNTGAQPSLLEALRHDRYAAHPYPDLSCGVLRLLALKLTRY